MHCMLFFCVGEADLRRQHPRPFGEPRARRAIARAGCHSESHEHARGEIARATQKVGTREMSKSGRCADLKHSWRSSALALSSRRCRSFCHWCRCHGRRPFDDESKGSSKGEASGTTEEEVAHGLRQFRRQHRESSEGISRTARAHAG